MKKNNNNTHIHIQYKYKIKRIKKKKCTSHIGHCRYLTDEMRQNDDQVIIFFRLDIFLFRYLLGHRSGVIPLVGGFYVVHGKVISLHCS